MSSEVAVGFGPGDQAVQTPPGAPVRLARPGERLSYRDARQPPCLSCPTSPCCTNLLLATIDFKTLMDVDHALFLLNFEGIFLALTASGVSAQVYLHQPCGYLDVGSGLCTVHSTPLQPAVCVNYKSQTCGYRHSMTTDLDPNYPLVDRARMTWLAERMVFDDERRVVGAPARQELLEAFRSIPMQRRPAPPPEPDPVTDEWRSIVLSEKGQPGGDRLPRRFSDQQVSDPCTGCGAWCCQRLVFERAVPADASELETLRYCLGFPGVEVTVGAEAWAVVVHTTCRHLQGGRCSVFGTKERPLRCGYYDALSCAYRPRFGVPRPEGVVRVSRDQFGVVCRSMVFDELGRIVAIPPTEVLRTRLEDAERARAAMSAVPCPSGSSEST